MNLFSTHASSVCGFFFFVFLVTIPIFQSHDSLFPCSFSLNSSNACRLIPVEPPAAASTVVEMEGVTKTKPRVVVEDPCSQAAAQQPEPVDITPFRRGRAAK